MNKNCYLTGVIYALTLLLLSERASSCAPTDWTEEGASFTINNVDYFCDYDIKVCRGGCTATTTYTVHVLDTSVNPRSKCSVSVNQCVSQAEDIKEVALQNCVYAINNTAVTLSYNIWRYEPTLCNCQLIVSDPVSGASCQDEFTYY